MKEKSAKPVVAVVGRPNVGKSTFFNRLIGERAAIVYDNPGVTRDYILRDCDWAGREFLLIDTGGLIVDAETEMGRHVKDQVSFAIEQADVIVFMVDAKEGVVGADEDIASMLRRTTKPIILAANKIDSQNEEANALEFYQLGLGDPLPLSAMRGTGAVGDLLDKIISHFPKQEMASSDEASEDNENLATQPFSIAIIGRPNVGKSSLVNAISGSKRSIVDKEAGTTRDAIDTTIDHNGRTITLIDTAGIRRKSRVEYGVEAFAVVRSLKAIDRCDVAALVIDVNEPISDQDQKIAAKIIDAGKACVIVANKWDLKEEKSSSVMNKMTEDIKSDLPQLKYHQIVFTSATNRQRVDKILTTAESAFAESRRRVGTSVLNQVINEAQILTPPPSGSRGKRLRIYYATQASIGPPTFILFVNDAKLMTNTYMSYIERKIRESFGFGGSPIRLALRNKNRD
jgi:GTP-binding protein